MLILLNDIRQEFKLGRMRVLCNLRANDSDGSEIPIPELSASFKLQGLSLRYRHESEIKLLGTVTVTEKSALSPSRSIPKRSSTITNYGSYYGFQNTRVSKCDFLRDRISKLADLCLDI